ncbi:TlpA family protein disulfide reductase [Sinomicrobium sp. M5D2P9]
MKKRTVKNILLILFVLSFFVTPLGFESKILLSRLFSPKPEIIEPRDREKISGYDWKLKDENWKVFNFNESDGRVVFVNFWASWRVPSIAERKSIQKLYDAYKDKVDFYVITNEEKEPVMELMEKRGYSFPVTYLIIGEKMPLDAKKVPSGYIIDKNGYIAAESDGIADWDNAGIRQLLDTLLQ